jgi:hypothetical protein
MIEVFPNIVSKTKEQNVICSFASCVTYITFFHLWMLGTTLLPLWLVSSMMCGSPSCYYEHNVVDATMATQVKLLNSFGLLNKVITYVEDKGSNLFILNSTLTHVVFCPPFQLPCQFEHWLLFWP